MSKILSAHDFTPELLAEWGLPLHVKWFALRVRADAIATVTCCYYPDDKAINSLMKTYELHECTPRDSITGDGSGEALPDLKGEYGE